jgi:hypothetical protein
MPTSALQLAKLQIENQQALLSRLCLNKTATDNRFNIVREQLVQMSNLEHLQWLQNQARIGKALEAHLDQQ